MSHNINYFADTNFSLSNSTTAFTGLNFYSCSLGLYLQVLLARVHHIIIMSYHLEFIIKQLIPSAGGRDFRMGILVIRKHRINIINYTAIAFLNKHGEVL
jgi:hypothetical protein